MSTFLPSEIGVRVKIKRHDVSNAMFIVEVITTVKALRNGVINLLLTLLLLSFTINIKKEKNIIHVESTLVIYIIFS